MINASYTTTTQPKPNTSCNRISDHKLVYLHHSGHHIGIQEFQTNKSAEKIYIDSEVSTIGGYQNTLALLHKNGQLSLLDLENKHEILSWKAHDTVNDSRVRVYPNHIITWVNKGYHSYEFKLWTRTGELLFTTHATFGWHSFDGKVLYTDNQEYHVETKQSRYPIWHRCYQETYVFATHKNQVICLHNDHKIRIWNQQGSAKEIFTTQFGDSLSHTIIHDGDTLVCELRQQVWLYDLVTGKERFLTKPSDSALVGIEDDQMVFATKDKFIFWDFSASLKRD